MAIVHSKRLATVPASSVAGTFGPFGPAGTSVWSIKDVIGSSDVSGIVGLNGFIIIDDLGGLIAGGGSTLATSLDLYEWHGTRVIEPGHTFEIVTFDDEWSVVVDGFEFTTP